MPVNYRFPAIRPDVPAPALWAGYLDEAYANRRFTNFGPLSRRLEAAFADKWGGAETVCVAASSATAALAAPLIAEGIEGTVLLPAFTFPATLAAVKMAGAVPVLIDVDASEWTIAPDALENAMRDVEVNAIILLAPFGLKRDFSTHIRIAARFGAKVIIDNAAGLGVDRAYPEADASVFEAYSLHATKPFAIGEGGMIFAHASRGDVLRSALNFGLATWTRTDGPHWGVNGKLSELHAAIGLAALHRYDDRIERRRSMARAYMSRIAPVTEVVASTDANASVWQVFPALMPDSRSADRCIEAARTRGMEVRRYYFPSLQRLAVARSIGDCEVAASLADRMCCFPIYAETDEYEREQMVEIFEASIRAGVAA